MNIKNKVIALVSDENGGELVEYAIVIGVLALAVGTLMTSIKSSVTTKFTGIDAALKN